MKAAMRMAASMVENRAKIRSAGSPPSSK